MDAIKGCASAMLGMIYTCLAYASIGQLDYQTDLMFLENLKALENLKVASNADNSDKINSKAQEEINNKIINRLKKHPTGSLAENLKKYQEQLELSQGFMNTSMNDDSSSDSSFSR